MQRDYYAARVHMSEPHNNLQVSSLADVAWSKGLLEAQALLAVK